MKKKNSAFFQASMLVLSFIIAVSISLMAVTPASAAITNPQAWSLVYGNTAYPGTYTYSVPAAINRVLVVAVSSTQGTAVAQTATVTYGGQTLTLAVGDAGTLARQHSYLFYLNEAGIAAAEAAVDTNLVVTVTGGTSNYNHVYAAVYAGVDQDSPITNSRNYNNSGANTAVGPFAPALTIDTGDWAVEVINITRTTGLPLTVRTINAWATNWSSAFGPNSQPYTANAQTAYIATNFTAGTTTSQHTASGNCWDSMSAMTLNAATPPAFTSVNSADVAIGQNQTFKVTAVGSPTISLSLAEALPSGMTFDPVTGIIGGTPAGPAGTYPLTFTADNLVAPNATQNFTLTVYSSTFPTGWGYRKCHTIINTGAGAGTHYQVRITAHFGDDNSGSYDLGENVYLNSRCRTDFADVRFVSSDGVTELDYWMETKTDGTSAVFWVEVLDDLSAAANQTIYIYYGNAAAATTSNGKNTFIFFDDFNGTLDLAKWARQSVSGLYPQIESTGADSYLRNGGGVASGSYGWTCLGSAPSYTGFQNNAVEFRYRVAATGISEVSFRGNFAANTGYKGRSDQRTDEGQSFLLRPYQVGVWTIITPPGQDTVEPAINTWYRGTITAFGTDFNYYQDNISRRTVTNAAYTGPGQISLQNHYGSYTDYDWVSVRKFVSSEPAHGTWCPEEPLAAALTVTKSVALVPGSDVAPIGVISAGDTLRYNVKMLNNGTVDLPDLPGDEFTDDLTSPPPIYTTYAGTMSIISGGGTVTDTGGQITWNGDLDIGVLVNITFDVIVNAGAVSGDVISNQGTVHYDSNNNGDIDETLPTDGNPGTPGIQPTLVTVGAPAQGFGTKTAWDVNGGSLEPGDILEYTVVITNSSGYPAATPMEFTDMIPANTTYIPGATTTVTPDVTTPAVAVDHPIVISYSAPTLTITGIDIGGVSPNNEITIKFRVQLAASMPVGVTQISNQADVFYDSDSVGGNDTHQATDGDGNLNNGMQPTLSPLGVYTISGTVFEDVNGDGIKDPGDPGISGVGVHLLADLLHTDINGNYIFTDLLAGTYTVTADNPDAIYYTPSTTNPDTRTVGPDATLNFGFETNGYADLSITKYCVPLRLDDTDQLVFVITVTNNGPNNLVAADNAELFDDLDALAAAGLTNIEYTVDGGARALWPLSPGSNTVPLGDMLSGSSKVIRIFANVASTFVPEENTASVVSDIFDPDTGNNDASCTPDIVVEGGRMAMEFIPASNRSVTVPSSPSLESISATGTIEAWIYVKEFNANSELIGKGNIAETFDIGLCGGVSGDEFAGGTAQNIGFALYETDGTQHLLIADNYTLNANKWYHIACVWDINGSPEMAIYINGVEEKTGSPGIDDIRTNTEDLKIGLNHIVGGRYIGIIDEVRIWDAARSPAQIQETMCHKLTASESDYVDLMGNWRFDETLGNPFCDDISSYGNLGYNNAARVCSSAPIGDASMPDYEDSDGFSVVFDYPAKDESLTVSAEEPFDNWTEALKSGLQVYRVNTVCCEDNSGPIGSRLLTDIGYWGVFVTGGDGPTYKVQYTYDETGDGIPGVGSGTDPHLNWRHGNCESWKNLNATPDPDLPRTLTIGGQTGTEFILGTDLPPRNAILYDGSTDYVSVPDNASLDLTTDGTLEAWIYINNIKASGIINKIYTTATPTIDGYSLALNASGNIVFSLHNSTATLPDPTSTILTSDTTLATATWHHIAATWDGTAMNLYINGVLDINSIPSAQESGITSSSDLTIATDNTNYFQGQIDEVRVWNIARSQAAVRDTMCQKLAGSETGLVGYWRFDEETDDIECPDETTNNNDGTMTGFGDNTIFPLDPIREFRVCSSAPIGDDSAYAYHDPSSVTPLTPVTAQLAHSDGDYMAATENGVDWTDDFSGLHIYRVDEAPVYQPDIWEDDYYDYQPQNGMVPPDDWSSIDYYRYWGVFITDSVNGPSYDVVYHYTGNPLTPDIDSVVGLAKRDEFCDRTWEDSLANLDAGADTLSLTGETGTEYIFGGINAPLAITLSSFNATTSDGCVEIAWETATEINTAGFHVWRSDNPLTGFVRVTSGMIASTSEMETMGAAYSFRDCGVDFSTGAKYYYMLEEIEMDTTGSGNMHGPIGPVTETITAAQGGSGSSDKACFIDSVMW